MCLGAADWKSMHSGEPRIGRISMQVGHPGARTVTHSEGQSMTAAVREWVKAESERLKIEDLEELRAQVAELKRLRSA